jgi:YfiH family protein
LRAETLELPGIEHGFFTRDDGTGEIAEHFKAPVSHLCFVHQVHGPQVFIATKSYDPLTPPEADAIVTQVPGLVIGVMTADCAPILLAESEAGVVGAIHAGWRGALEGVIEETLKVMKSLGAQPSKIHGAVGPCIFPESYEVDEVVRAQFKDQDASYFTPNQDKPGHFQFDLRHFVVNALKREGIASVSALLNNTYTTPDLFFSYRRESHQNLPRQGNQASCIVLR